jgi:superfamily I DNA/RNA helicase
LEAFFKLILSPYRKENSCLNGVDRIREWPLVDFKGSSNGIKFATVRSFKGLVADVVLLIGVKENSVQRMYTSAHLARGICCMFFITRIGKGMFRLRQERTGIL